MVRTDADSANPAQLSDDNRDAPHASASRVTTRAPAGSSATTPPLPWADVVMPPSYSIQPDGVFQIDDNSRIAGPVWVSAHTLDPLTGDHGVLVTWVDIQGKVNEIAVSRDDLYAQKGFLVLRLTRGGLWLTPGDDRKLTRYLASFDASGVPLKHSASRVGWIEKRDGALAYMMPRPTGLIAPQGFAPVIYQPERESPSSASLYPRGTLESWNATVVCLCRGNPLLLFPILVALSGPLLRFAELESGGFHYYGRSSHGKTTSAQVAASVWGNGTDPAEAPERAYVQKWNSTVNAFEALLTAHNDGLLVLDGIHTCDAKDFGAVLYNMSGGKGRQALDRERQLRQTRKWRASYFSTGEISVLRRLESDGREVHAGQLLRLIDIPIESGVIHSSHGSHAAHAEKLKSACAREFGTAGPAFVRELVREYSDTHALAGTIKVLMSHYAELLTPPDVAAEQRRAIKRFALLLASGELAVKLGILACEFNELLNAVRTTLRSWLQEASNLPDRLRGVLNVQNFIERSEARFQRTGNDVRVIPQDRAGFVGWDDVSNCPAYFFSSSGFAEACGGQESRETARELHSLGYLVAREHSRYAEKRDLGHGRQRVYVVKKSLLLFDPQAATAKTFGLSGATGATGAIDAR